MGFGKKAERVNVKAKVAIAGPSGSGKTYGALTLATSIANGKDIALLDSEGDRGLYEANNFDYFHESLEDTSSEGYIKKIKEAEKAGIGVLIIDSISHEWENITAEKDRMPGNPFQNWSKLTPRHDKFVNCILKSKMHIICTIRAKDKYVMELNDKGKQSVSKLGVGIVQRDTIEYEFTTVLMMEHKTLLATAVKDNTNIFDGESTRITANHGEKLYLWCEEGLDVNEQIIGTQKGVILKNWLKNKHNIELQEIEEYIKFRYEVSDIQYLRNKDKEDFAERLKENKFNLKLMIKNNL